MVEHPPAMQETQVQSWHWEDPLVWEMATTPVVLRGESHGQRSLAGYSPTVHRVAKSWTQLSTDKRIFL